MTQQQPNPRIVRPRISYPKTEPTKYILVGWPEIQDFMLHPRWNECVFCSKIEGHPCPDFTYAIPEDIYNEIYSKN